MREIALAALATTAGTGLATGAHADTITSRSSGSPRRPEEGRQFKVTGRFQYDLYNVDADCPAPANDQNYTTSDTRRVFLGVASRYTDAFRHDIKVAFKPNGGTVTPDDAFREYVNHDFFVIVGQNNAVTPMEDRTQLDW